MFNCSIWKWILLKNYWGVWERKVVECDRSRVESMGFSFRRESKSFEVS